MYLRDNIGLYTLRYQVWQNNVPFLKTQVMNASIYMDNDLEKLKKGTKKYEDPRTNVIITGLFFCGV